MTSTLGRHPPRPLTPAAPLAPLQVVEPDVIPDQGIWHPVAPRVFETTVEYMDWLKNEHAPALGIDADNAPIIGITLQKSHINTKDDAHYVSLVMELESKGALVVPTYARPRRARRRRRRAATSPPPSTPLPSRIALTLPSRLLAPAGTRARSTSRCASPTTSTSAARHSSTP